MDMSASGEQGRALQVMWVRACSARTCVAILTTLVSIRLSPGQHALQGPSVAATIARLSGKDRTMKMKFMVVAASLAFIGQAYASDDVMTASLLHQKYTDVVLASEF